MGCVRCVFIGQAPEFLDIARVVLVRRVIIPQALQTNVVSVVPTLFIENADATPPHPDVVVRLGSSGDMLGILKFICHGALSLMYAY